MADQRLRVLHVIDSLGRGGAEQLLATVLPELPPHGVVVAVLRGPYDLQCALEKRGVQVVRIPNFNKWNLPAGKRAIASICAREQINIVHAHLYFAGLYVGLFGANSSLPTFETFHNLAYAGANRGGVKLRFRKALRALVAKRSGSSFLAVSEAVASHYAEALDLESVTALPNAVDLSEIDAVAKVIEPASTSNHIKIVVPGRLVVEKGHIDLLHALSSADLPPYRLHFLGGGPLADQLAADAERMGIAVAISGTLVHREFLASLAEADLCVVPSRFEGFGIAAAEAMALGVPTIASDAGGLPEVLGGAGITVPSGDIDALRFAMETLLKDPAQMQALAQKGAQRVREKFSASSSAAHLASLYSAALKA